MLDPLFVIQLLSLLVGLAASLLQQYLRVVSRRKKRQKDKEVTLQEQVNDLTSTLKKSMTLLESIQQEITQRHQLSEKLKADAEKYDQLAQLKKEQADALIGEIRGTLQAENKKSFWKGVAVNLLFFVLGYAISFLTSMIGSK